MAFDRSDWLGLTLSVGLCALVLAVVRRRGAVRWISLLAFLPVPLVALVSPQFDLVGWHGFMHAAPVYQILEGGPVPPEEPLFAGGNLRYPWVEHWVVAHISRLTGANVHVLTLGIEVLAYGGFIAGAYWLASAVTNEAGAIALSVLFSAFGISIVHVGFLQEPFERAFPQLWLDSRVVPLDKFANISAMPVGYAALCISTAAALRLAAGLGSTRHLAGVVAVCTLIAVLVHPLSWACLVCIQGLVLAALVLGPFLSRERSTLNAREGFARALWLGLALAVPCLIALPYLRAIGISQSEDGWSGFTRPAALGWAKAANALIFVAPLLLCAYVQRSTLWRMVKAGNRVLALVLLATFVLAVAYLVLRFPGQNEYKFLLALVIPAAPVLALCTRALLERHALLTAGLLFALLTPGARSLAVRPWFAVTTPCRIAGQYLRALDPESDQIYQWVARETPHDAVFISADLAIPSLARRPLYIPIEQLWRGRDGWGLETHELREWHVRRPEAVMAARERLAEIVLATSWEQPASLVLASIQADLPNRSLYVYTQNPATIAKLDHTAGFKRRFQSARGAVFAASVPALGVASRSASR